MSGMSLITNVEPLKWDGSTLTRRTLITVQKIMETWHFFVFFLIIPHAKNVFLQPSVLLVKVDPSHLSGSTFVIKLIPLKKKKCFFTAKCSPSQGGPSPLERLNIRDQTCPKIKCKMSSKQALVTNNNSPA